MAISYHMYQLALMRDGLYYVLERSVWNGDAQSKEAFGPYSTEDEAKEILDRFCHSRKWAFHMTFDKFHHDTDVPVGYVIRPPWFPFTSQKLSN